MDCHVATLLAMTRGEGALVTILRKRGGVEQVFAVPHEPTNQGHLVS